MDEKEVIKYIRNKTGVGYYDCKVIMDIIFEAINTRPKIRDGNLKLQVTWIKN